MVHERATVVVLTCSFLATCAFFNSSHAQPDEDYVFALAGEVIGGDTVEVTVTFNYADGDDIDGYQMGVCHDDDDLSVTIDDIVDGSDLEDLPLPRVVRVYDDVGSSGWIAAALANPNTGGVIPADDYELYCVSYAREDSDAEETTIEFCDVLGDPEIITKFFIDGFDGEAVLEDLVVELAPEFMRGDSDSNGEVFPLGDALYLMRWAFEEGPIPDCMDATDVDDNGISNPLVDALFLLQFAFQYGEDPPDPGTDDCGWDPTDDEILCDEPSDDCA